jgi:hypothetical protein
LAVAAGAARAVLATSARKLRRLGGFKRNMGSVLHEEAAIVHVPGVAATPQS